MIASKLPVYNDTYQLLLTICKTVNNYSRLYKYSIGQSTIDTAIELFEYIQLANMFRDNRKRYLNGFIVKFENLKVKIRIASDVGQIGISKRAEIYTLMERIGRQITAWKNSPTKRISNGMS